MLKTVVLIVKDAGLCLLICTTVANVTLKNRRMFVSILLVIVLFLLGIDI